MRKIILGATSAIALATTAWAQDGFYVGGQLGINLHDPDFQDRDYDWYGHNQDFGSQGLSFGGFAGYVQENNGLLRGGEFGLNLLSNSETHIFSSDVQVSSEASLLASLSGRLGFSLDNTSIYGRAGLALANFDRSWTEYQDVSDSWPDLGGTKAGVILGFGIERALNERWSLRGEVTTSAFGENNSTNDDGYPLHITDRMTNASLGLTYHLGDTGRSSSSQPGTPANFAGSSIGATLGLGQSNVSQADAEYYYSGGSFNATDPGALAGLSFGHDWQNGATVLGVRVQALSPSMGGTYQIDGIDFDTGIDSIINLQGRAGMSVGNGLMYVLGGLSTAQVTNDYDSYSDVSGSYTGLTTGVGYQQFASDKLSWGVEATYTVYDGPTSVDYFQGSANNLMLAANLNYHLGAESRANGTGALVPTHDWSGTYYGFDLGLLANTGTIKDVDYYDYGGDLDLTSLGGGLGAHFGKNWQNGSFVYGAVADAMIFSNDNGHAFPDEVQSTLNSMATIRGRAGIASGNTLLYTTAGLAVSNGDLHYLREDFDMSGTQVGGVVGLGLEHALSDTKSFKIEALYAAFNEKSAENGDDCSGPVGFDGGNCNMTGHNGSMSIKAGMSFSF